MAPRAPTRLGPYEVLALLGEGGMGTVWRARHAALGVERALKVLAPVASPTAAARFEREVRALARVRHPGVVAIHEAGVEQGRPWFAMDLVAGEPLDLLLARGRLPLARALALGAALARAVDALHEAGLVHRDLKPGNVLVRPDGRPVVLDLGLAVAPDRDERLTRTGAFVGTPGYLAPEQLEGASPTPATDVHALGLLVFELATGEPLFDDEHGFEGLVAQITRGARRLPSALDAALPRTLDDVVTRATDRDPAARYARAGELADALEAVAVGAAAPARGVAGGRRALALGACLAVAALGALAALLAHRPGAAPGGGPAAAASAGPSGEPVAQARPASPASAAPAAGPPDAVAAQAAGDAAEARAALEALVAGASPGARRREGPLVVLEHGAGAGVVRAAFLADGAILTVDERGWTCRWTASDLSRAAAEAQVGPSTLLAACEGLALAGDARGGFTALDAATLTPVGHLAARALAFAPDGALAHVDEDRLALARPRPDGGLDELVARRPFVTPRLGPARLVAAAAGWVAVAHHPARDFEANGFPVPGRVELFARPDLAPARSLALPSVATAMAFGPGPAEAFAVGTASGLLLLAPRAGEDAEPLTARDTTYALVQTAHDGRVAGIAFTPDGRWLVSVGTGRDVDRAEHPGEVRLWDVAARRHAGAFGSERRPPRAVAVDPTGRLALVGTAAGAAELWCLPGGE